MQNNSEMEHALQRVNLPIERARGLPNSVYTATDAFVADRDKVISSSWTSIAFGSDVPVDWAVPVNIMGLPLLMTRDKQGELRVFHNVCSHRGMQLVAEPTRLGTGLIRCPYHSWTYDFSGDLRGTPMIGGTDKNEHEAFDPCKHGLKPIRSAVWLDNIYVNLSADAEPFATFIAPLKQRWSKWVTDSSLAEFSPAGSNGKMEITVNSNWKLAIENFLEAYHLPWVHPGLNSYSPLSEHYDIELGENYAGQGSSSYNSPAAVEGQNADLSQTLSSWPDEQKNFAEYPALYPNTLLGLQADHLFTMIVIPVSSNESLERVQLQFIGNVASDEQYADYRQQVLHNWQEVFAEDIFAVQRMQVGRSSPAYDGGVFSPVMDQHTHHFHKWVAHRLCSIG